MDVKLWSVFHDGSLVLTVGTVPGDLEFCLELQYIRERFKEPGNAFQLRIIGCDLASFTRFDTNLTEFGIGSLRGHDFELLSAKIDNDVLSIVTTSGIMRLRYASETISLDSGRVLQYVEIATAADEAVKEFLDKQ